MRAIFRTQILATLAAASLAAAAPGALAQSRSSATLVSRSGDGPGTVVVNIVDGEISAVVNGEQIPKDHIVRRGQGDGYDIRLPDGGTIHFRADADGGIRFIAPEPTEAPARGRIGVTLGEVDGVLADHLGLNPNEVFLITGVRDGLPAQRAGLRQRDIVTHINGESPVTIAKLTRLVSEMKPGEEVRFRVLRRGEPQEITVEVEASEPADPHNVFLGEIETLRRDSQLPFNIYSRIDPEQLKKHFGSLELGQAQIYRLREQLEPLRGQSVQIQLEAEKLVSELREGQAKLAATLRTEVEKLGNELDEETLNKVRQAMLEAARVLEDVDINIRFGAGLGAPRVEFLPNGDRRGAVVLERAPGPPAPPAAGHAPRQIEREIEDRDRNREEQERLKRLEERMERLEALLERLVERAG